jgi:hypothetical protein
MSAAAARAQEPPAALATPAATPAALPAATTRTRTFDTPDLERARRLAIATLQDLGLAIESGDPATGTLTASRLDAYPLRLRVTVTPQGDAQIVVTASADYAAQPLADAQPADQFLTAYESALFPQPELETTDSFE